MRVLSEQPPLTLISGLIRVTGQFTEHSATGLVRVTDAVSVSRVSQEYRVLPVLPPSTVRHQAIATTCSITHSHGYATDHAVLTCDVDLATAGLEVPTQPSSKDTRPPSRRLKTPVEKASQHRIGPERWKNALV